MQHVPDCHCHTKEDGEKFHPGLKCSGWEDIRCKWLSAKT